MENFRAFKLHRTATIIFKIFVPIKSQLVSKQTSNFFHKAIIEVIEINLRFLQELEKSNFYR